MNFKIVLMTLLAMLFIGSLSLQTLHAQRVFGKKSKTEKADGEQKKKGILNKELQEPEMIGFPARDRYATVVWDYYLKAKQLTEKAEFIKVDNSSGEKRITDVNGVDLTYESAVNQLEKLKKEFNAHQEYGKSLSKFSKSATDEQVTMKAQVKALKQLKNIKQMQLTANTQLTQGLVNLTKNLGLILKLKKAE